jgi:hypothetical protein
VLPWQSNPSRSQGLRPQSPTEHRKHSTAIFAIVILAGFLLASVLIWGATQLKVKVDKTPEDRRFAWELAHLFVLEVGIAIFVSCFIALTFEWLLHQRAEAEHARHLGEADRRHKVHLEQEGLQHKIHLEATQKNLFNTLFGFHLNPRLGDEIFQVLKNSSTFNREDCTLRFEFDAPPEPERARYAGNKDRGDDLLLVRATVSYSLRNTTGTPQRFPIEPYFENCLQLDREADRFTAYKIEGCDDRDGCVAAGELNEEQLRAKFKPEGIRRKLSLGEIQINPRCPAKFHFSYRTLRRTSDSHSWITVVPMDGIRVQAALLDPKLDLEFDIEAAHREDLLRLGSRTGPSPRVHEWRIEEAILPYQGVILYWHPPAKNKKTEAAK